MILELGFWGESWKDARAQVDAWVAAEPAVSGYRLRRLWQPVPNSRRWVAKVTLSFRENRQLRLAL